MQTITARPQVFRQSTLRVIPEDLKSHYGSGLQIPGYVSGANWRTDQAENKIRMSMYVILTTPIGTRLRRPDFGSMLFYLVANPYNDTLKPELIRATFEAVQRWEPRVHMIGVMIDETELASHRIAVVCEYVIKGITKPARYALPIRLDNASQPFYSNSGYTVSGMKVLG